MDRAKDCPLFHVQVNYREELGPGYLRGMYLLCSP
jgi:hypothetical protein